jgi:hypothetical protein
MFKRLLPVLLALCVPLLLASPAMAEFGISKFRIAATNQNGTPDLQAGSHPYALTTTFEMNLPSEPENGPEGDVKDLTVQLPPGLIGNPDATPRCTDREFTAVENQNGGTCPIDTAIGVESTYFTEPSGEISPYSTPVYNLVPPRGVVAAFGFVAAKRTPVLLLSSVRAGTDYGVTTSVPDVAQEAAIVASKVTLWGVPGEASHDPWRGACEREVGGSAEASLEGVGRGLRESEIEDEGPLYLESGLDIGMPESTCSAKSEQASLPLLTNPTSCGVPRTASISADDWEQPGSYLPDGSPNLEDPNWKSASTSLPALTGCQSLGFLPTLTVTPDKPDASTSNGLAVNVKLPQSSTQSPVGLAEAAIRDTTVVLPPGVALNPSAANGLEACSANPSALAVGELGSPGDGIGFNGIEELNKQFEPGVKTPIFTPSLPGGSTALLAGENALFEAGVNFCSNASKIGTVRIKLEVLEHELTGAVYLAAQEANPFGSVFAMYVVAEDPVSGVTVKLPGEMTLCKSVGEDPLNAAGEPIPGVRCQAVGQVVTTLENTPQAPVEEFELHLFGGEKAPLTTPAHCGTYTTQTSFVSWSGKTSDPSAPMEITSGPNGGPCPGSSLPFNPGLTGGALNLNAGAFSPFTLTMNRSDGEQNMQSVEAHLPPGLSGILSNIELCPEPQANLGECGPNSLIGETTVSVGVGGDPFTDTGGKFYLTGPYNGSGGCNVLEAGCAPFGITFEVPAKAGPFDLANTKLNHPSCDCILVRGKIEVNPITAALTVTSNPPGTPDAIPTSIEGIPLEIQHINAITTRGNFQFNPTNCNKMEVTGTIHSSEGGTDTIGVPFQVTNCKSLNFTPKFTVSTSGKTSKANGADLVTKVEEPSGSMGTQANLTKVKVELPKQLPSRLTTLQKACTDAQFNANPAGCPPASEIGHATVHTPLLPVPLTGPAIFVSHGGEAFPSLTIVLQGDGVKIDLVGTTFISKSGITSTTFKTVPDQPFSSFQLTLPEGKFSALAANGNLCTVKGGLKMPTEFIAQNGAELHQSTAVSSTGCSTALSVVSSKVKKGTLTLSVYAPAAGKVTTSGKGVSAGVKTYSNHEALTFTLKQKKAGKLKTKIKLTFVPSTGKDRKKQAKTVKERFKK